MRKFIFPLMVVLAASLAQGAGLNLEKAAPLAPAVAPPLLDGQLPQSLVSTGDGIIQKAYLKNPTGRYDHGVLGDRLEASALTVLLQNGKALTYTLPENRVFEDLEVRLADLNGDGADELLVVETDLKAGASLAVYGLDGENLVKLASTPFLGRAHRWLNPVGAGDFNGDGVMDIAFVTTPHIGGVLRLYSYTPPQFTEYAILEGVSTHYIGATTLNMGRVVTLKGKAMILAPNQAHNVLLLIEWKENALRIIAKKDLEAQLKGELVPTANNTFHVHLKNGTDYLITAIP